MEWVVFAPVGSIVVGGIIWRIRLMIHDAKGTTPRRRTRVRIKTVALRPVYARLQHLNAAENRAKESQTEHLEHRKQRRIAERQEWASDFEQLAGHTWSGPWEKVEPIEGKRQYYANKEHWEAIGPKARQVLINDQSGYYIESSDSDKRRIAIKAAAEWRKKTKGAPKPEIATLQDQVNDLQKKVAEKEAYVLQLQQMHSNLMGQQTVEVMTMSAGGPVFKIAPTHQPASAAEDIDGA